MWKPWKRPGICHRNQWPSWRWIYEFIRTYSLILLGLGSADAELDLWENWWAVEYRRAGSNIEYASMSIQTLLSLCQKHDLATTFPIIYGSLKILGTIPVTTAENERTISTLRRIKTYLRSTMKQERFSNLALLYVRRDFNIDLDEVVDKFATMHPRRMQLINLLSF